MERLSIVVVIGILLGGCAAHAQPSRTLVGDQSGTQYQEQPNGIVQNMNTGSIGVRRGAWVQDLQTGKLHYTYGNIIEEGR